VWSQKVNSMILVGPFQFRIFHDSYIAKKVRSTIKSRKIRTYTN